MSAAEKRGESSTAGDGAMFCTKQGLKSFANLNLIRFINGFANGSPHPVSAADQQ